MYIYVAVSTCWKGGNLHTRRNKVFASAKCSTELKIIEQKAAIRQDGDCEKMITTVLFILSSSKRENLRDWTDIRL